MIATSFFRTSRIQYIITTVLMVIITLPGTHLLANEDAPIARYKTSTANKQLEAAVAEAGKRIQDFFSATSNNEIAKLMLGDRLQESSSNQRLEKLKSALSHGAFEIAIELLPSADMNYHLSGFVPKMANGKPAILINSSWLDYGISDEALVRLILEGTGAAMEFQIEGKLGHGGERMANELSTIYKEKVASLQKADAIQLNGIRTTVYFQ